ncbi:DUF397 domain-containing protein [Streptomyces sp. NPDC049555]|uniref:DUF397 domain-containing protein n=1 Tax=Streptomyces sp. NPDC049555 TaxID=3154930 RepID=UPI003444FD0A
MSNELAWFTSSYSGSDGSACVEVALPWAKSSYSQGDGSACVEVATTPRTVHIRDSKRRGGPQLSIPAAAWAAFVAEAGAAGRGFPLPSRHQASVRAS